MSRINVLTGEIRDESLGSGRAEGGWNAQCD